jgi:cytochrome P450
MGWEGATTTLPYGKRLERHRRVLNHYLHREHMEDYQPIQRKAARQAAHRLFRAPSKYERIFFR